MVGSRCRTIALAIASLMSLPAFAQNAPFFTPGNLVVTVEGCGVHGGTCTSVPNGTGSGAGNSVAGGYGDNQGAPLTLFQYVPSGTSSATFVNSMILPQTASGANLPVSGEYGSSSEGSIQLSNSGQYLSVMGYGLNADTFNAAPATYGAAPSNALAQSGSLTGQSYTPVPRVVTLIDANGNVNSSTAVFNIFNTNNPRSAVTADGVSAYVSGQGADNDTTAGVFLVPIGTTTNNPTAITGLDATITSSSPSNDMNQDTRILQILNNTLYVSVDSKGGKNSARSFIGTLGTPPATSTFNGGAGPTQLSGIGTTKTGKITVTTGANTNGNSLNSVGPKANQAINLSPVNYFFASPSVLYIADSGFPKNDSNGDDNSNSTANLGDGGLQKWVNSAADGSGSWSLKYTLYQGLNLVNNGGTTGTTGLFGLAGTVSGNTVNLYATNYVISDLDQTYLLGVTDNLSFTTATQATAETFTVLDTAPPDSNFKGVSFAPSINPGSVEITSSPSGLSFTSAGAGCAPGTYTTPTTLVWTPGNSCTLSVTSPQAASAGTQYGFSQWEDGSTTTSHTVIAPASTAIYTATFTTQYQLTTAASAGGTVSAGGFFNAGSNVPVTATPNSGFYFVSFTGSVTSTSNPLSVVMSGPQSVTANFAQQTQQTITCTQGAPSSAVYGSNFSLACSASSGMAVAYSSGGACSNSGATYTMTSGTGTCSVAISQAGGGSYLPASVSQSVNATLASQTITVTTPAPATATLKSSFTVAATSTSGAAVTFGSSGGCTNVGGTYTMASTGAKACVETLNVPPSANYSAAPQVTENTTVAKAITQTVSFTGAPATAVYNSTFTVAASSNSSSTPVFTTTGPCSLNSSTLTVTMTSGVGVCSLTATWAADSTYNKATAVQHTTAQRIASVITWANPAAITYGTPLSAAQLNATASTTGSFAYSQPAGRILKAGVQGLSVKFTPSNTSDYAPATDAVTITVNPVDTTTAISTNTPNPSNSGQIVTFTVAVNQAITNTTKASGTATVTASTGESCSSKLTGGKTTCKITFTTPGARTVTASYPGDVNNNGSTSDQVSQTVN